MSKLLVLIVLFLGSGILCAADSFNKKMLTDTAEEMKPSLTGFNAEDPDNSGYARLLSFNNQKIELIQQADQETNGSAQAVEKRKSGAKAALMSAIIPGSGQIYAKSYWKAALFLGIEVAFWTASTIYDGKGDDEDKKMRAFGDQHWDEKVYWSNVYRQAILKDKWGSGDPAVQIDDQGLIADASYNDLVIDALRDKQSAVGYTHTLPETKTQQYYEMIYKYLHQFGNGWDDVVSTFNDPYFYDNTVNLGKLTPNMSNYRNMRNRSNEYYDVATTMVSLVMVNHLLSVFDAAYTVKKYNKKYHYSLKVKRQRFGYEPPLLTYGVQVTW